MATSVASYPHVEPQVQTFAEKFCSFHHIPPGRYEEQMLRRSLYFPGRLLLFLLGSKTTFFAPDREFLRAVGNFTQVHGFGAEMWAFTVNPENSRFHRLHLKMRVSTKRVFQQLNEIMRASSPAAVPPRDLPVSR
jgi:hypothetical protein